MGDPRKFKNHYVSPKKPYDKERIVTESKLKQKYGLRRNKEIWKAKYILRKYRRWARALIATKDEEQEKILFNQLRKYGLIGENATLEDILKLDVDDILNRRLQTIVYKKGFAKTPKQARQLIVHGHVLVDGVRIRVPSYLVEVEEEDAITLDPNSRFAKEVEIKESENA